MSTAPPKILLAKPGLDGHDRGIKVLAMALRDRGAEVVYLGLRHDARSILAAARDEDVDVVGISVLSGAHLYFGRQLLALRGEYGRPGLPIAIGGTIPKRDADQLRALGAAAVFPVGTPLDDAVDGVLALAGAPTGAAA